MCSKIVVAGLTLALTVAAARAQIPTRSESYRYSAVNRELKDALRGFAADQRLNIVFDPSIEPRTISEEVDLPPAEFLDYITGKYGLAWYYDGVSLYIYSAGNLSTRAFRLRFTTPAKVIEALKELNAYSEHFPFRTLEKEKVILAVAPPRMLEMTGLVIGTLEGNARTEASASLSVAVFPLKYASAADQSFTFEGTATVVPGVATILQSVVSGQAIPGKFSTFLPRNMHGLTGYGLNRFSQSSSSRYDNRLPPPSGRPSDVPPAAGDEFPPLAAAAEPRPGEGEPPPPPTPQSTGGVLVLPTISADTRTNSVVVRDLPERMEAYEQVIRALDQPTSLIEITARIIDVTKEGVFEWGLPYDFQFQLGDTSRQMSLQLTPTDSANLAVTLLKDDVIQFMSQIKALEQDGYARVASRPSLLTMDNVEAQIDNSETFFVRVEGDFEVELFDVSIGTTLNIIPHVINQDGKRLIRLNVQITDGSVLEQTVDEIPRIRSDTITTQAVLGENESLLLGGLFREEKSSTESRVPFLGSLPGVGVLFRSEEYNTSRIERLILIEPRIVALPTLVNGSLQLAPIETPLRLPHEAALDCAEPVWQVPSEPTPEELPAPYESSSSAPSVTPTPMRVASSRKQTTKSIQETNEQVSQNRPKKRSWFSWPSFDHRKSRRGNATDEAPRLRVASRVGGASGGIRRLPPPPQP